MKKSKFTLLAVSLTALALAACGGDNSQAKSRTPRSVVDESYEVIPLPEYNVQINGGDVTKVEAYSPLTKPADPTAPAGIVHSMAHSLGSFFDTPHGIANALLLPHVLRFNGEVCPDLLAFGGVAGTKMPGSTYSGGQKGKGLVFTDNHDEYQCSTIEGFDYYETEDGSLDLDDPEADEYYFEADIPNPLPAGKTADDYPIKERKHFDATHGAFIHYMYVEGDTLTWEIESSAAATNVQLFARLTGEYGHDRLLGEQTEVLFTFSSQQFQILVNDTALQYNDITIHNVVSKSFIPCQDFEISANVSLNAGPNKIQMKVNNSDVIFGTVGSTAPCVDCIKLYSSSTITWNKMNQVNLVTD